MSTISQDYRGYDYTSTLVSSYIGLFIDPKKFLNLFNTAQTGSAHISSGTDLPLFVRYLAASLGLCVVLLLLFSYLRAALGSFYHPRCYSVPVHERMEPPPRGYLNWILPVWSYNIQHYLHMGLDAYFFLRFLGILLIFFSTCGLLNLIVLLPVNFYGSDETYSATGLDRLSSSNIANSKIHFLNAHFVFSLITIGAFNYMIVYEMQCIVKIRQAYLGSASHRQLVSSRVLLLSNISPEFRDKDTIVALFDIFPGGVERVWFTDSFRDSDLDWKRAWEALDILEVAEVAYLRSQVRCLAAKKQKKVVDLKEYPPIELSSLTIPYINRHIRIKLPGFFRVLAVQPKTDVREWSTNTIANCLSNLLQRKIMIANGTSEKETRVFLLFKYHSSAYMAYQSLLSLQYGTFNQALIEVNPQDVLWRNVGRESNTFTHLEYYCADIFLILAIAADVIPVSFIGLLSQVPVVVQLFPFMNWLNHIPEALSDALSSFLPSVLLGVLTEFQLFLFRKLIYYKGKLTGSEVELNLQQWYFAFLFILQFLVVSILSSIIDVLIQVVGNPSAIPLLLAANIPKGAIFFFKLLAVRALSICGRSFLRVDELFLHYTLHKWKDCTPRRKVKRSTTLPVIKWGSLYPAFSVFGVIGLTYSIISPLISLFMIFILLLVLLYYKYSLRYMFSHINVSETHGKFYPKALLHLFAGIYCLECCIIGIFFSLRDIHGECPMKYQGLIMILVLMFTVFANIRVYSQFSRHFNQFPLFAADPSESQRRSEERPEMFLSECDRMMYFHPCYSHEKPQLWLPSDPFGKGSAELVQLLKYEDSFSGGTTDGAAFLVKGKCVTLQVTDAPPKFHNYP